MSFQPGKPTLARSLKILLVEDSRADVQITLRAFQDAGGLNQISVVKNGREALDYLRRQGAYAPPNAPPTPDLILLDIVMPLLDGIETLKILKADPVLRAIPVMMFTSSNNDSDVLRSYQLGAVSYIQKPICYDDLVAFLRGFNHYYEQIVRVSMDETRRGEVSLRDGKLSIRPHEMDFSPIILYTAPQNGSR